MMMMHLRAVKRHVFPMIQNKFLARHEPRRCLQTLLLVSKMRDKFAAQPIAHLLSVDGWSTACHDAQPAPKGTENRRSEISWRIITVNSDAGNSR